MDLPLLTQALESVREIVAHVNDIKRRSQVRDVCVACWRRASATESNAQAISRVAEINTKIVGSLSRAAVLLFWCVVDFARFADCRPSLNWPSQRDGASSRLVSSSSSSSASVTRGDADCCSTAS